MRATVRSGSREGALRGTLAGHVGDAALERFETVVVDLLNDDGWAVAVSGVDAVVHTASPMPFDTEADLIQTARSGTRRVLEVAADAGISRVVFTSSGVTAIPRDPIDRYAIAGALPARTTVFVGLPHEETLVEIDALAVVE